MVASADTELTPAEDTALLSDLLSTGTGEIELGGEDRAQFTEYLRARRLAQLVRETLSPMVRRPALDKEVAAE
ncbi:hypothetical protein [Nocardia sp. NPDC004415]